MISCFISWKPATRYTLNQYLAIFLSKHVQKYNYIDIDMILTLQKFQHIEHNYSSHGS